MGEQHDGKGPLGDRAVAAKQEVTVASRVTPEAAPRTRRSVLAATAAAVGALVAQAIGRPEPARAADVVLGGTNSTTRLTTIRNTAASSSAKAIAGRVTYTGSGASTTGVEGTSAANGGNGVVGKANIGTSAYGVWGLAAQGNGVVGSGGPTGVSGNGSTEGVRGQGGTYGVHGTGTYGVYGSGHYGIYGYTTVGNGGGVYGYNGATGGAAYGTYGVSSAYRGVYGYGPNAGVFATSPYVAAWNEATSTTGENFGVYATTASAAGWAGVFWGRVQVNGTLSKSGGSFQIDHPLDPENRYLQHSFVESPDMLNVYSGTVTLDDRGRATVRLPRYFGALNMEHRYQLTAVGQPAPNLHVAQTIRDNRFSIAGGPPRATVSWQVTGVRQDAWANANRIEVEPLKASKDRGSFLHPELFGKPASRAINRLTSRPVGRSAREPLTPGPDVPLKAAPSD